MLKLDENGMLALNYIVKCPIERRQQIIDVFKSHNFNLNILNGNGYSTFQIASFENDTNALRLLLLNGVNPYIGTDSINTPDNIFENLSLVWKEINFSKYSGLISSLQEILLQIRKSEYGREEAEYNLQNNRQNSFEDENKILNLKNSLATALLSLSIYLFLIFRKDYGRFIRVITVLFILLALSNFLWQVILKTFFIETGYVTSFSMYPYSQRGTYVIFTKSSNEVNRGDVVLLNPPSGINENGEKLILKRVIGLPGDTIEIKPASIYIKGENKTSELCGQLPMHAYLRDIYQISMEGIRIHKFKLFSGSNELSIDPLCEKTGIEKDNIKLFEGSLFINGDEINEDYICEDMDYTVNTFIVPDGKVFLLGDNRNRSIDSHIWSVLDQTLISGKVIYKKY